ncbi:MAG: DEAD/DEAH box helicase family protein [Candidatus Roizmanbacteria bacterium]
MNEAETRAEIIDPKLKESGWGIVKDSYIRREYQISRGRIKSDKSRSNPEIADYVLVYKNYKLAIIEAKAYGAGATEGVNQAKKYADILHIEYTYATDGNQIYEINMKTGKEQYLDRFPTPDELWNAINKQISEWKNKFDEIPYEYIHDSKSMRYYQEIAISEATDAIALEKKRILLTLATGAGKTFIAFQIVWKLFHARWNLKRDGLRRPRILFLADRNVLATQAFNNFSAFPEDVLVRIKTKDIRSKGIVPTNGSIFFTIFQTFMSGPNSTPYYGEYPKDFFDLIIIDECHRGGANDESNWRTILEYFSDAVQLGLTATPKQKDNVNTYKYFGEPVYTYSLKQGINDGFLTPFKVRRIQTTMDEYIYTKDDQVIEGAVEEGKVYDNNDFNVTIEIEEKESNRVKIMLEEILPYDKTIVFCANQGHARLIRDLINRQKPSPDPLYCVRVTANDGKIGDEYLDDFQDTEKTIPTILTTSQKLSTGIDAKNVRNIVLMRPINSMIEFKQIIGRGTRIFEGKTYFTVIDFVNAYANFSQPEWDGEPLENIEDSLETHDKNRKNINAIIDDETSDEDTVQKRIITRIKLRDGKEHEIQHMASTSIWDVEGKPLSASEFIQNLYEDISSIIPSLEQLIYIWSDPNSRTVFLQKLKSKGYGKDQLKIIQELIKAQDSDMYDVIAYVTFGIVPVSRTERITNAKKLLLKNHYTDAQQLFIEYVLSQYIISGVSELAEEKLPDLLKIYYHSINDAEKMLGGVTKIRDIFISFQKYLYA